MGFESGGYADKLGNRYEGRWVVLQMLFVLGGRNRAIQIESLGDDEQGVDLWVESNAGTREGQQCKAVHGTNARWTMADLHGKGVLHNLRFQLQRSAKHNLTLVSSVPAQSLIDLSRRARDSNGSSDDFYTYQISSNQEIKKEFHAFCQYLNLNPANSGDLRTGFSLLQRSDFHQFSGNAHDQQFLEELASHHVDAEPSVVVSVLADFAVANLRRVITADDISRHLIAEEFILRDLVRDDRITTRVNELRRMFQDTFAGQLAGDELISRSHASTVLDKLERHDFPPIVAVHGRAGYGKSGVLFELTSLLEEQGIPYLPFRLDRQPPSGTAQHFGAAWGLPDSPAMCLSLLVGETPAVLILDQIDAMRWTSGHASDPWLTCQQMIRQAIRLGNVRVVIACRTFDLENDPQFSTWLKTGGIEKVEVGALEEPAVRQILGKDFERMNARQRKLLGSVHNLSMWLQIRSLSGAPDGFVSATELMRKFWDSRYEELARRNVPADAVDQLLDLLVDYFNKHGSLSAPMRLIQRDSVAARELQSLNIIHITENKVAFGHQSYSDYLLALRLANDISEKSTTVFAWLEGRSNQSLFRREQLRLLLLLLRDENANSYIETIRSLLTSHSIRFHLKHLCLQVLGQASPLIDDEVQLVLKLIDDSVWREHVSSQILWRNPTWICNVRVQCKLRDWLSGEDESLIDQAVWLLRSVDTDCGDVVAEMLDPFEHLKRGQWPSRIDWMFVRYVHEDSDKLFNL